MGLTRNISSINLIVIHCSASPNGRRNTAADIDQWHAERGFKRSAPTGGSTVLHHIGYHYVGLVGGPVDAGRGPEEVGDVAGLNARSLGYCMVGTDAFDLRQWDSLHGFVVTIAKTLSIARGRSVPGFRRFTTSEALQAYSDIGIRVVGHRDCPKVYKTCPGFSVADWIDGGMHPLPGHIQPLGEHE